jgi:replicative DNA helicase
MSGTTAASTPRYEFGEEFQQKIAALLVRDTPFAQMTDGLVLPAFFENAGCASLVMIANKYFEKYKKAPGDKIVLVNLLRDAAAQKLLTPELLRLAAMAIPVLLATDVSDRDYVADECATFARHQAVGKAILDSVDLLDKRDFATIEKTVQTALSTGKVDTGGGYDYGEMTDARTQDRKDEAAGLRPPTGITTGFPILDGYLYHKGWGRREMAVLMGGPKAGKSMAMINFSINAIAAGYRTLYVTLEVASNIIAQRIDANVSERAIMELGSHISDVDAKVKAFMAKAAPLKIHEYPTGTMKPSHLRRLIEQYKSQSIVFDLVVVDYADLMVPERHMDNVQENSKNVYQPLRGMAMSEGFAMLTATQTNREGAKKTVATMTDVAEDINKVRIADVMISINRTEEEARNGRARLHFAASRNQRSGFSVLIEQNIDQGKFITAVLGEE